MREVISVFITGFGEARQSALNQHRMCRGQYRNGLYGPLLFSNVFLIQGVRRKKKAVKRAIVVQFYKSIVSATLEKPLPSMDGITNMKVQKVPGFYLEQPVPSGNHFVMVKRGKSRGTEKWQKGTQQSEENGCSSSSEGLRGRPGHREGCIDEQLLRCTIVFPQGQLQHGAEGAENQAGPGPHGIATVKLHIYCTEVSAFLFTPQLYSEQKIKLCGKYIYVYIYTHNRNCSNWVKDKVT